MQYRVELIGAAITIARRQLTGTQVRVRLRLGDAQAHATDPPAASVADD
jgi:hypothetical protein